MPSDLTPPLVKTETERQFDEQRRRVGIVVGPLAFLLVLAWPLAGPPQWAPA